MWTQDMFGVEKPIIALLHLDALPGDPGYLRRYENSLQNTQGKTLLALQDGGVDGILFFANEFQFLPYQPVADIAVVFGYGVYHRKIKRRDQRTVWR